MQILSPIANGFKTGLRKIFASILGLSALAAIGVVLLAAPAAQAQAYLPQTLHSFTGADGQNPRYGHLIADASGNLYGTTQYGGANGAGVVFELVKSGGTYSETVLHSFTSSGGDGQQPQFGLIMDSSGNLYGTTRTGGTDGHGTVFELAAPLTAGMSDIILHSFSTTGGDGESVAGGVIMDSSGNLYGTTGNGGAYGYGTVFELAAPLTAGMSDIVLHSFPGFPGPNPSPNVNYEQTPTSGLIMDSSGNLYGTTLTTVFELAAPLTAGMNDIVLHVFPTPQSPGSNVVPSVDGFEPDSGVIMDSSGNLYGTTLLGGPSGVGTVFELRAPLGPFMSDVLLYSFSLNLTANGFVDGFDPLAGLIIDSRGNLYGTTQAGGDDNAGTVFELVNNSGTYTEKKLKDFFPGCGADGAAPSAGLTMDSSGDLYGTTFEGGGTIQGVANNVGTVFELVPYSGPAFATSTSLTSSLSPATAGSAVSLTATVTSTSGHVLTGTVAFSSGALVLGNTPAVCGVAVWQVEDADTLGLGNVTLTAQYTPDSTAFLPSSGTFSETVNEPGAVLTSGNNTLNGNQTVNGTVNATSFIGNGSGLTGVSAATAATLTGSINDTQVNNLSADLASTAASAVSTADTYANNTFLPLSGGKLTGALAIGGGTPITEHLSKTFSVTVPAIPSNNCSTLTSLSLAGASDGDTLALGVPSALVAGTSGDVLEYFGYVVSGGNAVSIRVCNPHGGSASTSVSGSIRVDIWKH